ncbi:hypothetical protein TRVL_08912 [Trypanosoma vivax]|nr:hypothetical protein TRVL_08912 [Trypanosoma vivax]
MIFSSSISCCKKNEENIRFYERAHACLCVNCERPDTQTRMSEKVRLSGPSIPRSAKEHGSKLATRFWCNASARLPVRLTLPDRARLSATCSANGACHALVRRVN